MSEIDNGSTSQTPPLDVEEDVNLLNSESSTTSNSSSSVYFDAVTNVYSLDSYKKEECDLKQDLETKPYSFPLSIGISQISLEDRDANEDMKTDMSDKPTVVKSANCSENAKDSDTSNLSHEESIENDSAAFENEVPPVIASELLNLHSNIIHIKEKLKKAVSEANGNQQVTDETPNQIDLFQLPDIYENLNRKLSRDKIISHTGQEENFGTETDKAIYNIAQEVNFTKTDKTINNAVQEENFGTDTDKIITNTAQEANFGTKIDKTINNTVQANFGTESDKTINIASQQENYDTKTDKTISITEKEENYCTKTDKTMTITAPEKENYSTRTDKKITIAELKEDNARTANKIDSSGNFQEYSVESRNKGIESQALKSEIESDGLQNVKIFARLENTGTIKKKNANLNLKKSNDIMDVNIEKKQSSVSSLSNRKTETPSQAVNQTYLNALQYFQSLCDQPQSTVLGQKSDAYFQIRAQENKCVEIGNELKNLKGYLAGVKSDIVDLKLRCSDIQTSLKSVTDK